MKPIYIRVAIDAPLYRTFDYLPAENTDPAAFSAGKRVLVPFGQRQVVGIIVEQTDSSEVDVKKIRCLIRLLDNHAVFDESHLQWLHWVSAYYHHPLGATLFTALPVALRSAESAVPREEMVWRLAGAVDQNLSAKLKRAPKQLALLNFLTTMPDGANSQQLDMNFSHWRPMISALVEKGFVARGKPSVTLAADKPVPAPPLNASQQNAVDTIVAHGKHFGVFLLDGVTGSGKTEVYLQVATEIVAQRQQQVLILVPEIGLTPQLVDRVRRRFGVPMCVMHSAMNENERLLAWRSAADGTARIVIGTRSAIFTPMPALGLIIIDEEHDTSYKQQEGLRYSARDIGVVRAQRANIPMLLGSATPSLESLANVERKRFYSIRLPERAGKAIAPKIFLLDLRRQTLEEMFCATLLARVRQRLDADEQVLLFLNRRGYAPTLLCHACGWVAGCDRCSSRMTLHHKQQRLRCHHCGAEKPIPRQCAKCGEIDLRALGYGTERIETFLRERFADAEVFRIDRDSTRRKNSLHDMLERVNNGKRQILLGTQMLAKGHDFPNVTLVALLNADSGLFGVDIRASEHLAQLIVQVAGRAGRSDKRGEVYIQTHHPEHPLLTQLITQGYPGFAATALEERKSARLPPYTYNALLRAEAKQIEPATALLREIATQLRHDLGNRIEILGPAIAPMERKAGFFRLQLMLNSERRQDLHQAIDFALPRLEQAKKARWSIDVDPIDMQ